MEGDEEMEWSKNMEWYDEKPFFSAFFFIGTDILKQMISGKIEGMYSFSCFLNFLTDKWKKSKMMMKSINC